MVTWQTVQRYLRQAGVGGCFLSLAADPDFDPDGEFPLGRMVFGGYTCAGRYVRINPHDPMLLQILRQTRRVLGTRGLTLETQEWYDDGMELTVQAAGTEEPVALLDFRSATITKCKPSDRDENRPAKDQVWCLYTQDGDRLLGRHPTKEKALRQERAIQIRKHT